MSSLLRRRKGSASSSSSPGNKEPPSQITDEPEEKKPETHKKKKQKQWSCVDSCCWFIGCICVTWWVLLFLYNMMPSSFPQFVTEAINGPMPDPPGLKLKNLGLKAKHPVVFVPGIVTGGLELWEGHHCADGLFRKRLWGGTFGEVYKRLLLLLFFLLCYYSFLNKHQKCVCLFIL